MSSKQQDVAKPNVSPVLFMTVDGEPMSFFLRPGSVKCTLQPLITAGGGQLCNVQQPGAILLIHPEERGTIPDTTAHRYVSTQYIHDCVEKDEQLNLEDYRLNPEVAQRHSDRINNGKEGSPGLSGGRVAYTSEEDAAILSYVSKHETEVGGNRLWQEMEAQRVTSHSWQSMKYRYRARLAKKQFKVEEDKDNKETDSPRPSCEENAVPPLPLPAAAPFQQLSAETDPTQVVNTSVKIDAQPIPAKSTTDNVEAQTLSSPHGGVQHEEPQNNFETLESTQVDTTEAETSDSLQPEGPAQSTGPDEAEQQTIIYSQNESMAEDFLQSLPDTPSPVKRKVNQKASTKVEQLQRPKTRRQLELDMLSSPEPYGKKLRLSSTSADKSPPRPLKKTKSAVKSALQKDTATDQPPSKRARGKSLPAVVECQQESKEADVSETPQADEESNSLPQKGENKKEQRKLGILELATKEFETENESDEDETPALQNPTEMATIQPTLAEAPLPPLSTQSNPDRESSLQINGEEAHTSRSNHAPETGCPRSSSTGAVQVTSGAHLFVFDNESQEEDSQSLVGDNTAAAAVNKHTAHSLTQVQLEEDKQGIRDLMKQTNQDLCSVTKALVKTSGDFSAALNLLLNPSSFSGPFWNHSDDSLLLSADPVARQQLQEKYGEEDLAKRITFLEVEG